MFGIESGQNPLALRKQLLIAESEVNRARLLQAGRTLADEVGHLADRAKSFHTMASSVLSVVAALGAFTRNPPAPAASTSSWFQKIAGGVRLASTIWLMFRARNAGPEKK